MRLIAWRWTSVGFISNSTARSVWASSPAAVHTHQRDEGAEQARGNHHYGDKEQGHAWKRTSSLIVR